MGKKGYVNAEQLQLLDALHDHINKCGTTGEFLKSFNGDSGRSRSDPALIISGTEPNPLFHPPTLVAVVEAIVKRLLPTTGSRLSYLRDIRRSLRERLVIKHF